MAAAGSSFGYSAAEVRRKLESVDGTQPSVEMVALWLMHHERHAHESVTVWERLVREMDSAKRKLDLVYVANDVLQRSRRHGNTFANAFLPVLPAVLAHVYASGGPAHRDALRRIVNIWEQRGVYSSDNVKNFLTVMGVTHRDDLRFSVAPPPVTHGGDKDAAEAVSHDSGKGEKNDAVAARVASQRPANRAAKRHSESPVGTAEPTDAPAVASASKRPRCGDATTDRLIQLLEEHAAARTDDAVIRAQVAALPSEIVDAARIPELVGNPAAVQPLRETADQAVRLMAKYCGRLVAAMDDADRIVGLLQQCLSEQTAARSALQTELTECRGRLDAVRAVKTAVECRLGAAPTSDCAAGVSGADANGHGERANEEGTASAAPSSTVVGTDAGETCTAPPVPALQSPLPHADAASQPMLQTPP